MCPFLSFQFCTATQFSKPYNPYVCRRMESLWKQASPIGTEWDRLDLLFEYEWNFSNLEDAFEEGGVLNGKKVYLFSCTESTYLSFHDQIKVTYVPAVVAVVSPFPPSDKIGITSVQMDSEEILDMKQMKMDWVPYIPLGERGSSLERLESQIFILRADLEQMKFDHLKKFGYCLPYFYHPFKEDEREQSTNVDINYLIEPKPVVCQFDWELDDLEELTDELIMADELSEDQKDDFKEFVKEKVREGMGANREAREIRKKAREAMSEEEKDAFKNMKFYKFYPVSTPDTPNILSSKSSFINRYYGNAHEVF